MNFSMTTSSSSVWMRKLLFSCFGAMLILSAQKCIPQDNARQERIITNAWVDSVYNTMSQDERIGQLFMIRAHSDKGEDHIAQVENLIKKYHVGSLCFFQGTPEKQIELVNRYQALAGRVPLMIAIDGEWGLGMRMKESTISFPRQLTLGAIQDNQLIYEMGAEIARQLRRVGVTVNFAPVVDVNNNAQNPVIHTRSFGEDRKNVAEKALQYMKGMQDNGVLACAKHFPGHGDTDTDSHLDLPVINHNLARLDSIELYPFRELSKNGIGSVMVAHLHVPALDNRPNRPTTLSQNTITNLLKEKIGFEGLIFTDALEMEGVAKYHKSGQVEAEALLAGNDVLVLPKDVEAAVLEIKKYIASGKITSAHLEASVKKVLFAKHQLGLTKFSPLSVDSVRLQLNHPNALMIKRKLFEHAMTLVRNKEKMLPFGKLNEVKIASLSIGADKKTPFQERLDSYAKIQHLHTGTEVAPHLLGQLKSKDIVIVSLHGMSAAAKNNFGLTQSALNFIENLKKQTKVVVVIFGSPYSLKLFDKEDWVLQAYEEDVVAQDVAAQALFGGIPLDGKLPVTASEKSTYGTGISIEKRTRLGYTEPENVGLDSYTLAKIDSIAERAILSKATPGCVVLVAKDGQVVYNKAFGRHTYYEKSLPTRTDDLFDLASVTKIAATTVAMMKLYDEGKIDLDQTLGFYLPALRGSNKANLTIRDVMTHRAGLLGWIPFYKETLTKSRRNPQPSPTYYRRIKDSRYNVPITEKLFLREDYVDVIWNQIRTSKLHSTRSYKYSDLGFYLLSEVVQQLTGQPIDEYVDQELYQPLGMQTATYNPWEKFPIQRIVPTEEDKYFRRQKVQGYVHDMGAAMLGGVSGHAGLFANATDVATLMQMLLQKGEYGGNRFFDSTTVKYFTRREPLSTRVGIGFDLLKTNPNMKIGMPKDASGRTYGHIGFTGTCTWVDPDHNIVYVFLANRTYPSKDNYRINKLGVRSSILSVVYEAMGDRIAIEKPDDHGPLSLEALPKAPLVPIHSVAKKKYEKST